jgi:hypothetical protein
VNDLKKKNSQWWKHINQMKKMTFTPLEDVSILFSYYMFASNVDGKKVAAKKATLLFNFSYKLCYIQQIVTIRPFLTAPVLVLVLRISRNLILRTQDLIETTQNYGYWVLRIRVLVMLKTIKTRNVWSNAQK